MTHYAELYERVEEYREWLHKRTENSVYPEYPIYNECRLEFEKFIDHPARNDNDKVLDWDGSVIT